MNGSTALLEVDPFGLYFFDFVFLKDELFWHFPLSFLHFLLMFHRLTIYFDGRFVIYLLRGGPHKRMQLIFDDSELIVYFCQFQLFLVF